MFVCNKKTFLRTIPHESYFWGILGSSSLHHAGCLLPVWFLEASAKGLNKKLQLHCVRNKRA